MGIFPQATPIFSKLIQYIPLLEDDVIKILKKFLILMYDRSSTAYIMD